MATIKGSGNVKVWDYTIVNVSNSDVHSLYIVSNRRKISAFCAVLLIRIYFVHFIE